jgi:cell division protein FtsL
MRDLVVPVLLLLTVVTGMGSAYAKHESRKLFQELQRLEAERDAMNVEWGQLQLEQSTHTTHGKVEIAAHERLNMEIPSPERVVILRP